MHRRISLCRWLRSAPISDPVDQRNAPTLQVLFLALGLTIPASWVYFLASGGVPAGGYLLMAPALCMAVLALVCVVMIRRGYFRRAVTLYLAMLLLAQEINHLLMGFSTLAGNQIDQFLLLIIGGLVLGRRALWLILLALLFVAGSGFVVDAQRLLANGEPISRAYSHLPSVLFGYVLVTLVLDRTVTALRESLAESIQQRQALQHEMLERERTRAKLIHAQKMQATGRLASGIAHDFNHILGLISGYAGQRDRILSINGRVEMEQAIDRNLTRIASAAASGMQITHKLLAFNRPESARPQRFDISQALHDLQPMLRQLLPSSIRLHLPELQPGLLVHFDHSEFELMLLNLAANARDAMADGGEFRIGLQRSNDQSVALTLTDTGHGMRPEVLQQIFDPFYSTKSGAGGTGLGLTGIHDMVLNAGGDIHVESTPGHGTTFRILLPPPPDETAVA
ncbi:ATP-binding protein [Stenotrophomonas sp. SY1]|jgi:signal transduction histidine kinase|uniref:sensor histidine kinase n=1 Tax=Stenotrophomonas sp. SY1 TaxID=477235 RepID=UPI001E3D1984|nr:ATP-binding protein [Stenotrophomonas sp. SY1]MCD9086241.1 ATP-binding protein [Stenotrophomonas sp. SY1]